MIDPSHDDISEDYPLLEKQETLVDIAIVAHVRPRLSKGITDLL
jgi:hypothetical protein